MGVEKPQEAQRANALWKMKTDKDAGEEYYDPSRKDNILGRNKTRLALWEEYLKDPIVALNKALKCMEILCWRSRPECLAEGCLVLAGAGFLQSLWGKPIWEGVSPYLDPMGSVNVHGPGGELFFFLIQKEPATEPVGETFSPFFNADIRTAPPTLLC